MLVTKMAVRPDSHLKVMKAHYIGVKQTGRDPKKWTPSGTKEL